MFIFSILLVDWELFGANLLIVLPLSVISEDLRFRGANSLHDLSLECELFEISFMSEFRATKSV